MANPGGIRRRSGSKCARSGAPVVIRVERRPVGVTIRGMAGRLFAAEDGVWKDISARKDSRMIRIELRKSVESAVKGRANREL